MSGHSKWAKIKRAKGANDAKRGALFTKLARNITMAAQEAGGDPDMNFSLRLAIDKAKQANMPLDNIQRAIKKGTGELAGTGSIQRVTYEFVAGEGVNGLIDCATDNTNRTVSDIKNLVEKTGFKMAAPGSASWQFKELGQIEVGSAKLVKSEKYGEADKYVDASVEDLEMVLLDIEGIEDFEVLDPSADPDFEPDETRPSGRKFVWITTLKEKLKLVSETLQSQGWQVLDSQIAKVAENTVSPSDQFRAKVENFVAELEEHDDVDNIWTNMA